MNRSLRAGSIVVGFVGCMMFTGTAGAQSAAGTADAEKYSGTSGSQALQEQMYEARMKDILGEQPQGGQPSQGMEEQKGMKGAEESSQKMQGQRDKGGERTLGETNKKGMQ